MSDQDLSRAFDALEELLARNAEHPDPQAVAAWHETFKAALASAERGPQWPELKARGKSMELKLNQQVLAMQALMETVKQEMGTQGAGRRALSAYNPTRR